MGYLDELKRQADEARARNTVDLAALERNSLVTDGACQAAFRYLSSLAQQLNVLQPVSKAAYRFDSKNTFRNLKMSNFRCDSRLRKNRNAEVFDYVVLGFDLKTGTKVTIAKDFPPEIEKLEARLTQCGAEFTSEILTDPENGRFLEKRFELKADFHGVVRIAPRPRHGLDPVPGGQPRRLRDGDGAVPGVRGRQPAPRRAGALDRRRAERLPARRPAVAPGRVLGLHRL